LSIWFVDPGVVIERLVLSRDPLPTTYLGPPESFHAAVADAHRYASRDVFNDLDKLLFVSGMSDMDHLIPQKPICKEYDSEEHK
jgi:hypothetical protein